MTNIKPIETIYRGYRFRSRLEARWAVFFDAAKIKFEYEVEGYELGNGVRYLPDFWLPEVEVHVEIKPSFEMTWVSIEKLIRFAVDHDKPTLLVVGYPTSHEMYLVDRQTMQSWRDFEQDHTEYEEYFSTSPGAAGGYLQASLWGGACVEFGRVPRIFGLRLIFSQGSVYPGAAAAITAEALLKAKQARFEHGESGSQERA